MSRLSVVVFAVAVMASHADETNLTLTVDGVTYSNVTFGSVSPSSVSIRHSTGIARLPLAKLPPELQQRFGYDPQKAADWQKAKQKAEQQKAIQARLQYARRINGVVYDFSPVLAALDEGARIEKQEPTRTGGYVFPHSRAHGEFTQADLDGIARDNAAWNKVYSEWQKRLEVARGRVRQYNQYLLAGKAIQVVDGGLLVESRDFGGVGESRGLVFVKNYPNQKAVFDGSEVSYVLVMLAGRYQYTSTSGAGRTIPLYDCGVPVQDADFNGGIVLIKPDTK